MIFSTIITIKKTGIGSFLLSFSFSFFSPRCRSLEQTRLSASNIQDDDITHPVYFFHAAQYHLLVRLSALSLTLPYPTLPA